jgi:hypothetical protein
MNSAQVHSNIIPVFPCKVRDLNNASIGALLNAAEKPICFKNARNASVVMLIGPKWVEECNGIYKPTRVVVVQPQLELDIVKKQTMLPSDIQCQP